MSIRADSVRHSANQGKSTRLQAFVRKYRDCCAAIASREWRMFFEDGKFGGKFANSSKFNDHCGAAAAQMARAQVAAMLTSFVSNRQNEFRDAVQRSKLDPGIKHMLHVINGRKAWHDLKDRFGIETVEHNPAYTSQECEVCGFTDRGNRKSQSEFRCLHCGHTAHADVNGAKVIAKRRSLGLDFRFASRVQVLGVLRQRFAERHRPGTKASSGRPKRCCCGGFAAGGAALRGNEAFAGVSHGAYHECQ